MINHDSFIASLANTKDVSRHSAFIASCAQRGELDALRDLFAQISEQFPLGPADWALRAVVESIVEAVSRRMKQRPRRSGASDIAKNGQASA